MCYMGALKRVGVRELRQNLSVYLARVIDGEALEVTDRGHAVAVLAPLVRGESVLSRLKREGRVIPATAELPTDRKPRRRRVSRSASRDLQRDRADRVL
jgi:prevent-host-death family protein